MAKIPLALEITKNMTTGLERLAVANLLYTLREIHVIFCAMSLIYLIIELKQL